jgi:hypothetical protein
VSDGEMNLDAAYILARAHKRRDEEGSEMLLNTWGLFEGDEMPNEAKPFAVSVGTVTWLPRWVVARIALGELWSLTQEEPLDL